MICKFCRSEVEEYIWHQVKDRVVIRIECPVCGKLDPMTLLPVCKNQVAMETP